MEQACSDVKSGCMHSSAAKAKATSVNKVDVHLVDSRWGRDYRTPASFAGGSLGQHPQRLT
jgi:hypothetical protein